MSKEPVKASKTEKWDKISILLFIFSLGVLISLMWTSAFIQAAQIQYEASLTPEERKEIAYQKALEIVEKSVEAEKAQRQSAEDFGRLIQHLLSPLTLPIFAFGFIVGAFFMFTRRGY